MTDRPILFSGPMVRALLEGRKTQTRRVLTRLPRFGPVTEFGPSTTTGYDWHFRDRGMRWHDLRAHELPLPYAVGDRLWVRETIKVQQISHYHDARGRRATVCVDYPASDGMAFDDYRKFYEFDASAVPERRMNGKDGLAKATPGIHMPRYASRLTLTVTNVKVERLQDISREDVIAEGIAERDGQPIEDVVAGWHEPYAALWDRLNGERAGCAWADNPWSER